MRVLIDEQRPDSLAPWLTARGIDAVHVSQIGLSAASDADVRNAAASRGLAILTKDEDHVLLKLALSTGPAVVWLRIGNATNPALFIWLERRLPAILDALARGETIIEVR